MYNKQILPVRLLSFCLHYCYHVSLLVLNESNIIKTDIQTWANENPCNKYNIVCNKCDRRSMLWRLSLQQ